MHLLSLVYVSYLWHTGPTDIKTQSIIMPLLNGSLAPPGAVFPQRIQSSESPKALAKTQMSRPLVIDSEAVDLA